MKRILLIILIIISSATFLRAQRIWNHTPARLGNTYSHSDTVAKPFLSNHKIFNNLEVAVSLGSSGVGIELATPITRWARLRAGLDWLPSFNVPMNFGINTFSDGLPNGNFQRVQELVYELTGIEVDDEVKMLGKPNMLNFKFLIDIFPFQNNRHWHFTAGFYIGNHKIATAINDKSEKPTLVGLNIYNRAYEYFTNITDIFDVPIGGGNYMDPDEVEKLIDRFHHYGRMGMLIGYFNKDIIDGEGNIVYKKNDPYIMEPAPDGSIRAKAYVNKFKPYVGFGYETALDKSQRWNLSIEAGAMFWGGFPAVINHDYHNNCDINMTKDLRNIRGKVGDYISFIKALPVFPVIGVKFSYTIF